eukprot:scaffold2820_cov160-Amphora_coffeaeformis.AAC.10
MSSTTYQGQTWYRPSNPFVALPNVVFMQCTRAFTTEQPEFYQSSWSCGGIDANSRESTMRKKYRRNRAHCFANAFRIDSIQPY